MTKNCKTCAWFCHTDGKCYAGPERIDRGAEYVRDRAMACKTWTFDGLEEWERQACEALMTMEPA